VYRRDEPTAVKTRDAAIEKSDYGVLADGRAVERYALRSTTGLRASVITYGGAITEIHIPDRDGRVANVALGYPDLGGYCGGDATFFGALIGRYANRIAGGRFTVAGRACSVPTTDGPNALHGGLKGFDKVVWDATPGDAKDGAAALTLRHESPDGNEGFPGTLAVEVTYTLAGDELRIAYRARSDRDTIVNLTNHTYFNLAGEASGDVCGQELTIDADAYTPVDATLIPTGEIASVEGTPFDFRRPQPIGRQLRDDHPQLRIGRGYDHNWVLNRSAGDPPSLALRGHDPVSGRTVDVLTTEPGVQVYSGNLISGNEIGSGGQLYRRHAGWTAETQHFPDSPNQPRFPSTALRAGETFRSETVFRFSAGVRT
jgi:aldose 1-epimerase